MDDRKLTRAVTRITHEILEHNGGAETLSLIGIVTRGSHLAKRIAAIIEELEGVSVPVGLMDISLYRDDVHSKLSQPNVRATEILFELDDRNVILVDDVLCSGRTIRAALSQIMDFGRPRTVQLVALVDRGHRELPIKADFVGANIPTSRDDEVVVEVSETDGRDRVSVIKAKKKTVRKTVSRNKSKKSGGSSK